MQEVLTMIANFGFPVVVAAYLLVRIEGKLEKLALAFHLAPEFEGERDPVDLGEGHREYVIHCRLRSLESGQVVASGLGSCNTLESRVRSRFTPDPASPEKGAALPDAYNLILKQAKKRALVDAVLTATASSDLFAQDLETLPPAAEGTTKKAVSRPSSGLLLPASLKTARNVNAARICPTFAG